MRAVLHLLVLLAMACDNSKQSVDDEQDVDGDGYVIGVDCDDADVAVHPGADELCNGVDDDCDGAVDEQGGVVDGQDYYADQDGDGFGDDDNYTSACEQLTGYVEVGGDCADNDADAYPGNAEVCDGSDNDCDGTTDEDDAVDAPTWYLDTDGDGDGDAEVSRVSCEAPSGYVATGTDCNDLRTDVGPLADEFCDGVDNDCDGEEDEADALDATTFYADVDGDGFGQDGATVTACYAETGYADVGGDCDDDRTDVYPGGDEVCDSVDNDCNGEIDESTASDAAVWYDDSDGDGYGDDSSGILSCDALTGTVAVGGDCDDTDPASSPALVEVCDGSDNDCDGTTDENDAADVGTWYLDGDGDGYGYGAVTVDACDQPTGYVADDSDCDDGAASANPGESEQCDGIDNNCDGDVDEDDAVDAVTWYYDADGDGYGLTSRSDVDCDAPTDYVDADGDCDDADADAHPAATEYCDGFDNNCDGSTDETTAADADDWYRDSDGDGYGDSSSTTAACTQPTGYVASSTDCDDRAATSYPGATETCDGDDNDCDGSADEAGATGGTTYYRDADRDSFGDASSTSSACSAPSGYVANTTDCDDTDSGVNPAATETCDGEDDDCDGTVDEAAASDAKTWYRDADSDGYGGSTDSERACSASSGYVSTSTDCDDSDASAYPGATETCDGDDDDCDGTIDDGATDTTTWYRDYDNDSYGVSTDTKTQCEQPSGYVSTSGDCNDVSAAVNPAATETCDGVDNNCDSSTDGADSSDATTYYDDDDRDNYGDASDTQGACSRPTGYVTNDDDCDDTDSGVRPGATETCDGEDDDCDGEVDESTASDATTYYLDADADGYGLTSSTTKSCSVPSGYSATSGDCNDSSAAAYPGGTEICDTLDNDCDGSTDESSATDALTWYRDSDSDGYGKLTVTSSSCSKPTGYVADSTDCDDTKSAVNPGEDETCFNSIDDDCDGSTDESCADEHCGTISADETWEANEYGHYVSCDVYVQGTARPELTIEDGAVVEFASGTDLFVGYGSYGSLAVDGLVDGAVFTSAEASPASGDWNGVYFGSYDQGSIVAGLTVEYAGANGYGALYLVGADPIITDSAVQFSSTAGLYATTGAYPEITGTTFQDNDGSGVVLYSSAGLATSGGPTFIDNVVMNNGSYPVAISASYLDQLDASSQLSGNGSDYVYVYAATVSADAQWQALDVPYYVAGDIYIQGTAHPIVTIDDGVEMRLVSGADLFVGYGSYGTLEVNGSTEGVTFTSYRASTTPAAGDWSGVWFGSYDEGSIIEGLTVSYAGGNGYGGIYTVGADPLFLDCAVNYSTTSGFYVSTGSYPIIEGCNVHDNDNYGVYLASGAGLETSGGPTFIDNTITDNGDYPLAIAPEYLAQVDGSNALVGNDDDFVYVHAGTVATTNTWYALDVPAYVAGDIYIQGTARPVITIEDGARFYVSSSSDIFVGYGSYGEIAVTGSTTGVVFTSYRADSSPRAGDWSGLWFGSYDTGSTLDGVTVSYGGGNGYGNIYMVGADPIISDCLVDSSTTHGLYVASGSYPEVTGCTFEDNDNTGVYISGGGLSTAAPPTFTDNVMTGNGDYPIYLSATDLTQIDDTSSYTGNTKDLVAVTGGTVSTDGDWSALDVDYYFTTDTYIQGTVRPVVDIAPGATLTFASGVDLFVGYGSYGGLTAIGTATAPITFTSSKATPSAGDWNGIWFGSNCEDSYTVLTYAEVSYGGANGKGNLYFYACDGTFSSSTTAYSSTWGVYRTSSSPTLTDVTYTSNTSGTYY
jgi:parallel beta-helix repeat protein